MAAPGMPDAVQTQEDADRVVPVQNPAATTTDAAQTRDGGGLVVRVSETVETTDNAPTPGVEERLVPTPAAETARYSDWIARVVVSTAKVAIRARSETWKPRNAATRPMPGKSRPL